VRNETRLKDTVKWFVLSEELISSGNHVLAAVSGGSDSMAMLSILGGLSSELGFRLSVAYFDHHIRDSGAEDKKVVAGLARDLNVPFSAGEADVRAEAAASGDNLEEAARKARYGFLLSLADQIGADRMATGHTANDQVETVLMRVLRGTGIRGLAGIPTRRGRVIRPLLSISGEDTLDYCRTQNIPFLRDPSNEERRFFRNRLRLDLLPTLRTEYNEGVDDNLLRLAKNAGEMVSAARRVTEPLIERHVRRGGTEEWIVNVAPLVGLDDMTIVIFLGDVLAGPMQCDMDFSRTHYEALVRLIRDSRGSGKRLSLPGLTVKKEYENLVFARAKSAATVRSLQYRAALTVPGETNAAGVIIRTEIVPWSTIKEPRVEAAPRAAYFALDRLKLPLVLRCPTAGDRMQPFGMTGTKKLSDIFIDKKVPGRERARSLVVTDAEEILWLVGVTTCEKSRIDHDTDKVVRITVEDESGSR
jgi:tRNA(Ile)-lysidine synthase